MFSFLIKNASVFVQSKWLHCLFIVHSMGIKVVFATQTSYPKIIKTAFGGLEAPPTYFNDGRVRVVPKNSFGSEILDKTEFLGSMKSAGVSLKHRNFLLFFFGGGGIGSYLSSVQINNNISEIYCLCGTSVRPSPLPPSVIRISEWGTLGGGGGCLYLLFLSWIEPRVLCMTYTFIIQL